MKPLFFGLYGVLLAVSIGFLWYGSHLSSPETAQQRDDNSTFAKATIEKVIDNTALVKLAEGSGKTVSVKLNDMFVHEKYTKGETVTLYVAKSKETGETTYDIADLYHMNGLIISLFLFIGVVLLVARKKGFYSLLSVAISLLFFYFFFLHFAESGISPITSGLLYVFIVTGLTVPLIHGFNWKSISVLLAVNCGYILSFGLTFFLRNLAQLGSTPSEEFRTLFIQNSAISVSEVLTISLFLGAMGALIDVAVTVSSAVFEGAKKHGRSHFAENYHLGMEIGKDILGSMVNTLLLAYIAASLPFFLLVGIQNLNAGELLNYDFIALELTRTFLGGISMVILIPITAGISAWLIQRFSEEIQEKAIEKVDLRLLR